MPGWTDALPAFDLPAAPKRVDELLSAAPGVVEVVRAEVPAGRFLVICSAAPLALAFEATLFDLLAENRYPAPRPRRARSGSLIARLPSDGVAAACYAWPVGEELSPAKATPSQLLEAGRLLARLHQLGEAHPAKVADGTDAKSLLCHCEAGSQRDALAEVLSVPLEPLPSGAVHGGMVPGRALFIGDRCSAVLPSGVACFGPLAIDLGDAAVGFLCEERPLLSLRALVLGYQSLRRLLPEEVQALPQVLRLAAAREGVRRAARGAAFAISALETVRALGDDEIRAVAAA